MQKRDHFFIYPEDKNGKKTGHTICILLGVDKDGKPRAYYGISLCSEKDQFEYVTGRQLSLTRAIEAETKRIMPEVL